MNSTIMNKTGILFILLVYLLAAAVSVQAAPLLQTTPTPVYGETLVDIDGETLVLDQRVTIGDMGTLIALLAIFTVLVIYVIFRMTVHYLK